MPGVKDIAAEFEAFTHALSAERSELIDYITSLHNGFEGWLKLEFYFWLIKNRKLRASLSDKEHDVGMEYKVALDQRYGAMDRQTKQCDLWIRDQKTDGYHFIELKAPFANANQSKMLLSAADDFWYMSRLTEKFERVVTGSTIALGIRFGAEDWAAHIDKVKAYSKVPSKELTVKLGSLGNHAQAQWAVLTTRY